MLLIPGSQGLMAVKLSRLTGFRLGYAQLEKLPSGEKYVRISGEVRGDVVIVNSLAHNPDEMLMESLFLAETLKEYGAERVFAVFPYFPYSRERVIRGEAFPIRIIARIFSCIDRMYVVDFHLERMVDEFPFEVVNLTAMEELAEYARNFDVSDPVVIGPDEEAVRWASIVAEKLGADYRYMRKIRVDAENVIIESAPADVEGRDVIIVDDMISTGATVVQAIKVLKRAGCGKIYVMCTHPVLTSDALRRILENGAEEVVGTDTVPSPISYVSVAPLLSRALLEG
ncbi:ribose-phosphate diphosphokinase [Archaeoglobus veneficus]|uniref:ribose-phosphate diphosphokinase n=1 Tax=Archaeoglobus veneficus (strain DSM 11195 / SNP6) TaxID=693661 RepID=F2KPK6_ARCVS|nr:ribose-phosphate diphosphokinase [Archaeoglobus veneficus]AEA47534.1 ribose-phosphate pyrophosphokinase [Archaeoglobus veneficus SNP6]